MRLALVLCSLLPFILAAPFSNDATYTDAVARSKMLPLAAAAYSKSPQTCLTNRFTKATLNPSVKLKRQLTVKCGPAGKEDKCSGFSAVLEGDQAIVLSFRGTDTFLQLVVESDQSVFSAQVSWIAGGKVSKYFNDAFMDLWNGGMKDDFNTLRSKYPSYKVWVTGHSLGGAMATLAASYVVGAKLVPAANVELVTFGQPRTGNKDFAAAHDNQNMYSYRVTHWRDVVPHVPPENLEGYRHHKSEAFYHNDKSGASFKVCDADEDKGCSDGLDITTSIPDHLHYFDVDVSAYGDKGCK
ncbi:triacylglycerol lipase [Cooperia oncophora]